MLFEDLLKFCIVIREAGDRLPDLAGLVNGSLRQASHKWSPGLKSRMPSGPHSE